MVRISLVSVLVTLTLASVTPVAMALPGIGDAMKGVMPGAEKSAEADGATQLSAAMLRIVSSPSLEKFFVMLLLHKVRF